MRSGWWVIVLGCAACSPNVTPGIPLPLDAGLAMEMGNTPLPRCSELVPDPLRAELLPGWEEAPPVSLGNDPRAFGFCCFRNRKTQSSLTVAVDCRARPSEGTLSRMKAALVARGATVVNEVGRTAVRSTLGSNMEQLIAWDDDSDCTVTTTWLGEGREGLLELTRRLLQGRPSPVGEFWQDAGSP